MEIYEKINNIKTKQDFIEFLGDLKEDYKNNRGDWENDSLSSYLTAIKSFTEDCDGYYKNHNIKAEELSKWRIFADILYAGKIYE